jgi:hypothetical protein
LLVSGFSIAASIERDESQFYFRRFTAAEFARCGATIVKESEVAGDDVEPVKADAL